MAGLSKECLLAELSSEESVVRVIVKRLKVSKKVARQVAPACVFVLLGDKCTIGRNGEGREDLEGVSYGLKRLTRRRPRLGEISAGCRGVLRVLFLPCM